MKFAKSGKINAEALGISRQIAPLRWCSHFFQKFKLSLVPDMIGMLVSTKVIEMKGCNKKIYFKNDFITAWNCIEFGGARDANKFKLTWKQADSLWRITSLHDIVRFLPPLLNSNFLFGMIIGAGFQLNCFWYNVSAAFTLWEYRRAFHIDSRDLLPSFPHFFRFWRQIWDIYIYNHGRCFCFHFVQYYGKHTRWIYRTTCA